MRDCLRPRRLIEAGVPAALPLPFASLPEVCCPDEAWPAPPSDLVTPNEALLPD